jgi:hypothetical protein
MPLRLKPLCFLPLRRLRRHLPLAGEDKQCHSAGAAWLPELSPRWTRAVMPTDSASS